MLLKVPVMPAVASTNVHLSPSDVIGSRVAAAPLNSTKRFPPRIAAAPVLSGECSVALVIAAVYVLVDCRRSWPVELKLTLGPVTLRRRPKVAVPVPVAGVPVG